MREELAKRDIAFRGARLRTLRKRLRRERIAIEQRTGEKQPPLLDKRCLVAGSTRP